MKISEVKNCKRHGKFFQVNTDNKEQIKKAEKIYNEFVREFYPEIKNIPLSIRTFAFEENDGRINISSIYLEEQELVFQLRKKIEEEFKIK